MFVFYQTELWLLDIPSRGDLKYFGEKVIKSNDFYLENPQVTGNPSYNSAWELHNLWECFKLPLWGDSGRFKQEMKMNYAF